MMPDSASLDADAAKARVTVAHYSADEVIRQFLMVYEGLGFKSILDDMGIARHRFVLRRKGMQDLRAMSMALWRLALTRSFPNDADTFFEEFCMKAPMLCAERSSAKKLRARLDVYVALVEEKKDADFSPVAGYFAEYLGIHEQDMARFQLKLSLIVRNLYVLIFDRLV